MKVFLHSVSFFFLFFLVSCTPSQKIVYNTEKIQQFTGSSDISISIQQFEDIRSDFEANAAHMFTQKVIANLNGKDRCINVEKLYKIPVGLQMADIFAGHLNKKMYFSNVLVNQKEKTDYYITASLKHFSGTQDYSVAAAVGAGFGLIGAIATAGLKTEGDIVIELSDVCLYDKDDNLIVRVGDFKKEYSGKFPVDANCYCIYRNINQKLMEFNEELCSVIFYEVANANRNMTIK